MLMAMQQGTGDSMTADSLVGGGNLPPGSQPQLLTPASAWRILCHRTGIPVSRATFYRWLGSGRVFSMRMGQKLFIPVPTIEAIINHCRAGQRF
jgi:hypothetical protein